MDSYLLNYILGFLKLCSYCQTYQYNNEITCCICKKFHCNRCLDQFQKVHGFYESFYCNDCYKDLHIV